MLAYSQDIISSAFITSGAVSLGQNAGIQFTVNQATVCDSYTVESQFNYTAKTLNIKVNYIYISSCNESIGSTTEIQAPLFLLEGTYSVSLELSVPNDPFLNETTQLGSITVTEPNTINCHSPFIPIITESCPINFNTVCACDGQNYTNECEAFFEAKNGRYFNFNCGQYVNNESQDFECSLFSNNLPNTFERYDCLQDYFPGPELYLKYQHDAVDEPVDISFNNHGGVSRLFLVETSTGNLNCITSSQNNILTIEGISTGEYFLIFDSQSTTPQNIEFCIASHVEDFAFSSDLDIYPNPSQDYFTIDHPDPIEQLTIFNLLGQVVFETMNLSDNQVKHHLRKGTYQVQIKSRNGKLYCQKIIVSR
jgi:hypothetical protein